MSPSYNEVHGEVCVRKGHSLALKQAGYELLVPESDSHNHNIGCLDIQKSENFTARMTADAYVRLLNAGLELHILQHPKGHQDHENACKFVGAVLDHHDLPDNVHRELLPDTQLPDDSGADEPYGPSTELALNAAPITGPRSEHALTIGFSPEELDDLPPTQMFNKQFETARLLFYPNASKLQVKARDWIEVDYKSQDNAAAKRCFAVTQSLDEVSCQISTEDIKCRLSYDAHSDCIELKNYSRFTIIVQKHYPLEPRVRKVAHTECLEICPGSWAIYTDTSKEQETVLIRVQPRKVGLHQVFGLPIRTIAGSKRRRTDNNSTLSQARSDQRLMLGRLSSLSELPDATQGIVGPLDKPEYTLRRLRHIGSTKTSIVFTAVHSSVKEKIIAAKILRKTDGFSITSRADSWRRERDGHFGLKHKNICLLLGGDARQSVLFMQYCNDPDLTQSHWCDQDGNFLGAKEDARRVLLGISSALAYIHGCSINHCDIKSANILCGKEIKLIDFGLSTRAGEICTGGSPKYVAPEFLRGRRDSPADIYALAVVGAFMFRKIKLPEKMKTYKPWKLMDIVMWSRNAETKIRLGPLDVDSRRIPADFAETEARVQLQVEHMRKWMGYIVGIQSSLDDEDDEEATFLSRMLSNVAEHRPSASDSEAFWKKLVPKVQAQES